MFSDVDVADAQSFAGGEAVDDTWPDLEHALAQLPADQREAIVLRYADELSYEEMARVTGAGQLALKMRVQRAFARDSWWGRRWRWPSSRVGRALCCAGACSSLERWHSLWVSVPLPWSRSVPHGIPC